MVSDEEKQTLLGLKSSHGETTEAPKRITLKRDYYLKNGYWQGRKTVNVEVRKKRTYVKRDQAEEAPEPVVEESVAEEVQQSVPAPAPKSEPLVDDIEERRQAALRRQAEEKAAEEAAEAVVEVEKEAPAQKADKKPTKKVDTAKKQTPDNCAQRQKP